MDIVELFKPYKIIYILIIIFILNSCNDNDKLFELKNDTGIQFNNKLSPTPSLNILSYLYYYNGAGIAAGDFNRDGFKDILVAGNDIEISTQFGRLDASHGTLLINDQKGFFTFKTGQSFDISGQARDIKKLSINGTEYFIVSINNNTPVFLKYNE
ncbi:MAG: hypothetical protein DRJ07_11975 [Bacteroidetes bacterium]|nr:MAG: hypothetical protein DRJ07_11975 [Bacteroidota bacterium]